MLFQNFVSNEEAEDWDGSCDIPIGRPCHYQRWLIKYIGYISASTSLKTTVIPGIHGHCSVAWYLVQIAHVWTMCNGHSCWLCFFRQHGKKMAKLCFANDCFCLVCRTSNCIVRVPKMSVLKSSRRLPISTLITPPLGGLFPLVIESQLPDLVHVLPHEHLIHNQTISS